MTANYERMQLNDYNGVCAFVVDCYTKFRFSIERGSVPLSWILYSHGSTPVICYGIPLFNTSLDQPPPRSPPVHPRLFFQSSLSASDPPRHPTPWTLQPPPRSAPAHFPGSLLHLLLDLPTKHTSSRRSSLILCFYSVLWSFGNRVKEDYATRCFCHIVSNHGFYNPCR